MKRVLLALSAVVALGAGSMGVANALDIGVGPGGIHVGPHRHYYDYSDSCRTVIEHHTNRFGDDVTVRRHTCD